MHADFSPSRPSPDHSDTSDVVSGLSARNRNHKAVSAAHRAYLTLASAALAAGMLLSLAGCQTPPQPTYNGMVPPPATGAAGQAAPYGPVGAPQVSYAQTPGPMPGPASSWQGAAPANQPPPGYPAPPPAYTGAPPQQPPPGSQPPANTPPGSTWNWSQSQPPAQQAAPPITPASPPGTTAPPAAQQPPANGYPPPTYNGQQPYGAAPANGYQQPPAAQPQPWTGQYQPPPQQAAPQQAAAGNWWPFSDPNAIPPARATPTAVPRY